MVSAGSTVILLGVILPAGCLVPAGSNVIMLAVILSCCLILLVGWSLSLVTTFLLVVSIPA
ncbi:hypothetical protein Tco_0659511, partial [Tanacetum coccineum]